MEDKIQLALAYFLKAYYSFSKIELKPPAADSKIPTKTFVPYKTTILRPNIPAASTSLKF